MQKFIGERVRDHKDILEVISTGRYSLLPRLWKAPEVQVTTFRDIVLSLVEELSSPLIEVEAIGGCLVTRKDVKEGGSVRLERFPRLYDSPENSWHLYVDGKLVAQGNQRPRIMYTKDVLTGPWTSHMSLTSDDFTFRTDMTWPQHFNAGMSYLVERERSEVIFARKINGTRGKFVSIASRESQNVYDLEVIDAKSKVMEEITSVPL